MSRSKEGKEQNPFAPPQADSVNVRRGNPFLLKAFVGGGLGSIGHLVILSSAIARGIPSIYAELWLRTGIDVWSLQPIVEIGLLVGPPLITTTAVYWRYRCWLIACSSIAIQGIVLALFGLIVLCSM